MVALCLLADSYFDGVAEHPSKNGPYLISIENDRIRSVDAGAKDAPFDRRVSFVMPGLVEAHAHMFLDGGEFDYEKRNAYFKAPLGEMMKVVRENVTRNAEAGVTLVRDAGDRYGINDAIRAEQAARQAPNLVVRSPGLGMKRPKRTAASSSATSRLAATSERWWPTRRARPTTSRSS